jgi:hypothetical protein
MKDTARSSGFFYVETQLGWFVMSTTHKTGVFDVEGSCFQAICSCGWLSTISFIEEVDLLRALHAHQIAVFGQEDSNA